MMTSPRRTKESGQCVVQNVDWDSPSANTGTVKRRQSHPASDKLNFETQEVLFEVQTPSDSGSGTSRSFSDDKTESLVDVEQRISSLINESRSRSNSEASDVDVIIDSVLNNPDDNDLFRSPQNDILSSDNSKKDFKSKNLLSVHEKNSSNVADLLSSSKKVKERKLKPPSSIKKLNKSLDIVKTTKLIKETPKHEEKASVLPVYKSTVQGTIDLRDNNLKKKSTSKLRLPFTPTLAMDKPKLNFFQNKNATHENKPSHLLSSPVRRTISNEYVRLKFTNDTVLRRTIDGKSIPKITPKIQSIIPESPVDNEDPFLNLSPNKKYTVTVNNRVRCDKDNYVIFDPATGFKPQEEAAGARQSRVPLKSPSGDKSKIPVKSSPCDKTGAVRKSANVSDTDSGILSPNSPVETSDHSSGYYVNAATFSAAAKKTVTDLDITILDPGLAKKAAEQIKVNNFQNELINLTGCDDMARKYMERRFSKTHRTTIPTSFKVPEPSEFYNKATPFVQRTLLFVADESSGPKPSSSTSTYENIQDVSNEESTLSAVKSEEQEKSPKKSSFFFSPSKSCKLHGRSFFRLPTSPKKSKAEAAPTGDGAGPKAAAGTAAGNGGLISYAPGWSLKGEHLMKWQASGKTTIEIYTDWANHYLERARSRRRAGTSGAGLARDCADGLLLADVLEGVTGLKVPRAHRKPRNPQQMLENVQCCLDFLHAQKVQGLEQVTAVDIRDAKLKAVLALFFALSRHKQAVKQRAAPSSGNVLNVSKTSGDDASLSSVQRITGGSSSDEVLTACGNSVEMTTLAANRQVSVLQTSIPLPASAAATRRAPPDKRPLPATPVHSGGKCGLSASSSRSTSPLGQGAVSFIPRAPSSSGSRPNSSLLAPGSKIPSTVPQTQQQTQSVNQNGPATKHSMLDKFKLFNKEKLNNEKQNKTTTVSKRTSSSSGFSSAKSERSDSSLSLNESSNAPNAHIKSNIIGPKTIRQQNDTLSKDKSGKNVKSKLVSSKAPKESSTNLSKSSSKTNNYDKSRNSPKLPSRDKESRIATPKSISSTKLNQIDDPSRNPKSKMETKTLKPCGSQMRLTDTDNTGEQRGHENSTFAKNSQAQGSPGSQGFGTPNHTGIPKPTAAVKGTFKMSKDERHGIHKSTNSQLSPIQSNSSLNSTNNVSALPFSREQSNLSKEMSQKQTLAVSPMPVINSSNQHATSQMSESSHSNSTHSTTGQHSNSSDSVIYRPSSESGSELSKPGNISRRLDMNTTYIKDVINEAEISEKEAAQKRLLESAGLRPVTEQNTSESNKKLESCSRSSTPSHCRDNSLGDDENPLMNVIPMRPLLRGYNSHLTLPMRTTGLAQKNVPGYPHHANTVKANFGRENVGLRDRLNYGPGFSNPDYCDLEIASGYMSDGDCLRRININEMECGRNNDIMDGYMSEGGASLYGRRINFQQASQLQQLDERRGGRSRMEGGGSGVVYRVVGRTRSKADCGQQTERQPPAPRQDTTWKKYTDSPGVGTPPHGQQAPPSPSHSRKGERRAGHHSPQHHKRDKLTAAQQLGIAPHPQYAPLNSSQHSSRSGGPQPQLQSPSGGSRPSSVSSGGNGSSCSSNKAKVPQSFGYVKRQNGLQQPATQSNGPPQHGHSGGGAGRTAQVSAVPRTKVKISGGTQTCTQDLQIHKNGIGPKSYSLGGTAAAQLSASVRERLLGSQSLPKPGTHEFAALFHHHRIPPRGGMKISDGSLSDTQTYSEVKSDYGIPYAPWLRHSNTYSASGRLSEGESMESLTSLHAAQAHNHTSSPNSHHRSSLTHNKLIMHRDAQGSRLNRSNSIRSTKSEKLYPSMLQRSSESDYEPYYCLPVQYGPGGQGLNYGVSEPPSPSPRSALSPTHQPANVMHTPRHSHHYPKKNDDGSPPLTLGTSYTLRKEVHGSTASLVSTASSLAAGAGSEERQAHEVTPVRKLRRELADAKEKVHTLTTQLTTNAHVVSAFEQSLSNMTQRLQSLTATAERKDSELTELRQTIELLRKQSIQAGLTTAHMQSMGIRADGVNVTGQEATAQAPQSSPQRTAQAGNGAITRHLSTDSVSSINSLSSGSSAHLDKKHKKKGWLRSSFTKAFSRNAKISKTAKHSSLGQLSSQESSSGSHHYDDPHTIREGSNENSLEHSHEVLTDAAKDKPAATAEEQSKEKEDAHLVDELKRQLREKDLVLTDIRLEALTSAHQLENLKDTVIKMRNEMLNLKQNNERLQRLVTSRSLAGSQSSLGTGGSAVEDPRRFSLADQGSMHQTSLDIHSQPLDLDFNCLTSTPTMDFSKKGSPKSGLLEPIYGNKSICDLDDDTGNTLMGLNGSGDIFSNGLGGSDRLSGDYDINSVLPPPKCRELAIGESYSDVGVPDNQGDTADGKKIAIAVYLGQPETFQRYFEEVQDTLTESECRFYAKQSSGGYNNHFEKQSSFESPRMSTNHSPEAETQDYPQSINKSNTNSLKSNKSTHSSSFKNVYNSDSTINCNEFTIAYTYISGKTTWQNLDYIVRKTFKDFLSRIDPGTNLGLNTDSITSYHLGEATRGPEIGFPELLPCGYIVGTVNTLYICLQGVGSLAFDSLIPKNIVYRYVSLLSEHRRVILCGPSGTGKSYLAAKLAEFYVQRTQRRGNPAEAVATFNVDRKSCNEVRAYLANIAEQCGAAAAGEEALPSVVVLDNLQHASALGDAFAGLLPPDNRNMPVIIGTMSQATCNTTNLQLHHNFRWLLTANHMEPVKGFLARYLRRKLFSLELKIGRREAALASVLEWLPGVWSALNAFLEAHSSSDVTVGPRLFLACPMDLEASQAWFADVWNYSIVPYASEAVREGVALYGRRRNAALDPLHHVRATYPWREPNHSHTLRPIMAEDANSDEANKDAANKDNQDPLLNMLMRLQEAANYSGNQSQDSDNASMDSNLTHDSSMGNEL